MILSSMDEIDWDDTNQSDYPRYTITGTTNRDYALSSSLKILKIKKVEATPDGTNWYTATPFDSGASDLALGSDTQADTEFSIYAPRYDMIANSLFLYPRFTAAQVTAGAKVRVEYFREPIEYTTAEVTTGTKEPGFDEPFHIMIALGMCHDWFSSKRLWNEDNSVLTELGDYEARLKQHYGSKAQDRRHALTAAIEDYS